MPLVLGARVGRRASTFVGLQGENHSGSVQGKQAEAGDEWEIDDGEVYGPSARSECHPRLSDFACYDLTGIARLTINDWSTPPNDDAQY